MADTKIINISKLGMVEEPNGEENLLVEVNGKMRRLPSSNFSAAGSGASTGGSSLGYDIIGTVTSEFIPTNGDLVVDENTLRVTMKQAESMGTKFYKIENNAWVEVAVEDLPEGDIVLIKIDADADTIDEVDISNYSSNDPATYYQFQSEYLMFIEMFGDTTNWNTNDIHGKNFVLYSHDDQTDTDLTLQEMTMYAVYDGETWTQVESLEKLISEGLGQMELVHHATSAYTFAELDQLRKERPINICLGYVLSDGPLSMPIYMYSAADYTDYIKMKMLSDSEELEDMPEALTEGLLSGNFICFIMGTFTDDEPCGQLVLWEGLEAGEPVLKMAGYYDVSM